MLQCHFIVVDRDEPGAIDHVASSLQHHFVQALGNAPPRCLGLVLVGAIWNLQKLDEILHASVVRHWAPISEQNIDAHKLDQLLLAF